MAVSEVGSRQRLAVTNLEKLSNTLGHINVDLEEPGETCTSCSSLPAQ